MKIESRLEQILGFAAAFLLVVGCFVVLRPFVSALLWAAILCFSTWPLYSRVERLVKGRQTLAATLMTLLIAVVLVAPFTIVGISMADSVASLIDSVRAMAKDGPPDPPPWVANIPVVGKYIENYWLDLAHNTDRLTEMTAQFFKASRGWLLRRGFDIGQGVAQLSLSVFIAFFFYRDGQSVARSIKDTAKRIIGDRTQQFLELAGGTVKGVVYGILGTALAQGILAGIGFWIAGVPGALLLGFLTFFLSLVPMGPPLVWVPATVWLFYNHHTWQGIFLLIWGAGIVSTIDNVLKPYLISRGSNLPFVLVFMGVLGGVIAFGFIGVFIGPTLLAIGYSLIQEWSSEKKGADTAGAAPSTPPAAAR